MSAHDILTTFLDIIAELGAATIVATHDSRVAGRFSIAWHMNDGSLETGVMCST
jgi:ABC-type lipoprotein export system ATPase subunit